MPVRRGPGWRSTRRRGSARRRQGHRRAAFCRECRVAGAGVLLGLEMTLGVRDVGLRGLEIGRRALLGTGDPRGLDRLPRVAHFLHRGALATHEPGDDQKRYDMPPHKMEATLATAAKRVKPAALADRAGTVRVSLRGRSDRRR